jgi:uncharacterized RDD family membrane protein YckC
VNDLRYREVVTPEGVPLRFAVARVGDRMGAFLIDGTLIAGACVVLAVALIPLLSMRGVTAAVGLLAFFLLRNFYFTWFECLWQGTTPGKRALGLRVIDARGGMLTPEAVFARNLMREVELFLPAVALLAPEALLPDVPRWMRLPALAWLLVFAALPFFNRDRLRVGDLVGGTMVVRSPRTLLRDDLSAAPGRRAGPAAAELAFTVEQLDLYGIRELHLLESLLREARPRREALQAVAARIQLKIGWTAPPGTRPDAEAFLRAFYTAQRARLEHRLLLGERRQTKRAGRLSRRP